VFFILKLVNDVQWSIFKLYFVQRKVEAGNLSVSSSGNVRARSSDGTDWSSGACCCRYSGWCFVLLFLVHK